MICLNTLHPTIFMIVISSYLRLLRIQPTSNSGIKRSKDGSVEAVKGDNVVMSRFTAASTILC